jgi:hypothetical protein
MEAGRPGEVTSGNETYVKAYSPRVYAAGPDVNSLSRSSSGVINDGFQHSPSSSIYRAASADVLAKRQHIANIIREAEEEAETDSLIGKSLQIDMVFSI